MFWLSKRLEDEFDESTEDEEDLTVSNRVAVVVVVADVFDADFIWLLPTKFELVKETDNFCSHRALKSFPKLEFRLICLRFFESEFRISIGFEFVCPMFIGVDDLFEFDLSLDSSLSSEL